MMKSLISLVLFVGSTHAYARTDLKPVMAKTCEQLGDTQGVNCVKLQRQLESENSSIDENGASICDLVRQVGSNDSNPNAIAELVLSCFRQVSNLKVSNEARDTCNEPVYVMQGLSEPIEIVRGKVERMMKCIGKLGVSTRKFKAG